MQEEDDKPLAFLAEHPSAIGCLMYPSNFVLGNPRFFAFFSAHIVWVMGTQRSMATALLLMDSGSISFTN